MRSMYDPAPEQIRAWAASPDADEPVQDWDLCLAHLPNEELYLELAADWICPNRHYFLALLYLMVGDAVRTGFQARSEGAVLDLLERSRKYKHPELGAWRHRSRALLADPQTFDYAAWCGGGLAREGA